MKPYDTMAEGDLLSTEEGFKKLLNGVYIDLNKDELYGQTLTVEMVEIMGRVLSDRYRSIDLGAIILILKQPELHYRVLAYETRQYVGQGVCIDS